MVVSLIAPRLSLSLVSLAPSAVPRVVSATVSVAVQIDSSSCTTTSAEPAVDDTL